MVSKGSRRRAKTHDRGIPINPNMVSPRAAGIEEAAERLMKKGLEF